jgi:hypothetical protein
MNNIQTDKLEVKINEGKSVTTITVDPQKVETPREPGASTLRSILERTDALVEVRVNYARLQENSGPTMVKALEYTNYFRIPGKEILEKTPSISISTVTTASANSLILVCEPRIVFSVEI